MDVQLNNRYMSQLEELEQLKGQLVLPRTRNLSSDRQQTNGMIVSEVRSSRNSEKSSQSVEKFLNLRQQNQNVDNLINTWKQQKTHSISLNQGSIASNIIQETPENESPKLKLGTFTHLIIEEEEPQQFPIPHTKVVSKVKQNIKEQASFDKKKPLQQQPTQVRKNTLGARPQTSKVQVPPPQTPSQVAQKKQTAPKNMKQSQEIVQSEGQTPSQQKMKSSLLLEKTRQGKMNQAIGKVMAKKNSDEERLMIQQITKLKESVVKLYESRFEKSKIHSQIFIGKQQINNQIRNFDQILNTMKLDFRCLEDDGQQQI